MEKLAQYFENLKNLDKLELENANKKAENKVPRHIKFSRYFESLSEFTIECTVEEKNTYVCYFLDKHPAKTLIFCRSVVCVKRLSNILFLSGYIVFPLHSFMRSVEKSKNLARFKDCTGAILVTTVPAVFGIDLPPIVHVIHYQVPKTKKEYLSRIGNIKRSSVGITLFLMEPYERQIYNNICPSKNDDLSNFPIEEARFKKAKEKVNLAYDFEKLRQEEEDAHFRRSLPKNLKKIYIDD